MKTYIEKFFSEYFCEYVGNPTMNGGNFYYENTKKEQTEYNFFYYLSSCLLCYKRVREYGYGSQQSGFKHINLEINGAHNSEERIQGFLDIIEQSCIDLNDYISFKNTKMFNPKYFNNEEVKAYSSDKKDITFGEGLFWFFVRLKRLDYAEKFKQYVSKSILEDNIVNLEYDIEYSKEYIKRNKSNSIDAQNMKKHHQNKLELLKTELEFYNTIKKNYD